MFKVKKSLRTNQYKLSQNVKEVKQLKRSKKRNTRFFDYLFKAHFSSHFLVLL